MTTVTLKGVAGRYAAFAEILGKIDALVSSFTSPLVAEREKLAQISKQLAAAGLKGLELARDCEEVYRKAIDTDRLTVKLIAGKTGAMILHHYRTSNSLLDQALKFIPADTPDHLAARVDTLLWLCDHGSETANLDNLRLLDVARERRRQDEKHGVQSNLNNHEEFVVLMEEVGEVVRAMNEDQPEDMERELVEVAACAVKWLTNIERQRRREEERNGYVMHGISPNSPRNPAHDLGDAA